MCQRAEWEQHRRLCFPLKERLFSHIEREIAGDSDLLLVQLKRFEPYRCEKSAAEVLFVENAVGAGLVAVTLPHEVADAVVDLCEEGRISLVAVEDVRAAVTKAGDTAETLFPPLIANGQLRLCVPMWLLLKVRLGIDPNGGRWHWDSPHHKAICFRWD